LSNNYSSYQLFKQTLDFISKFDFGASALVLSKDKDILVCFIHSYQLAISQRKHELS
jgi:hypothetical protein